MFINQLKKHLLSGILALAPLFLTILIVGWLIRLTDKFVVNPLFKVLPFGYIDAATKIFLAKMAIVLCVIVFIILVGAAVERFIFKQLFSKFERIFSSIPLFNTVYNSLKEVAQAFFKDKKGLFRRVVFIEYPRKGLYAMAFVTQESEWEINEKIGKKTINVLVPAPPNPATGFFLIVPEDQVIDSDITIEQAVRLVISAGAAIPGSRNLKSKSGN